MPGVSDTPAPGERRYWCSAGQRPDEVLFDPDETRHLRRVMRLRPGDVLSAIDGTGRVLRVELLPGRSAEAEGRVLEVREQEPDPGPELWLGQAFIRPARMEWLMEKAVEIGLAGFQPILSRRAAQARQWGSARRDRLDRIVRSALAQSLGTRPPILADPRPLAELELDEFETVYVAHGAAGETLPGHSREGRVLLLVGPEGGFDDSELADLLTRGAVPISLGARRLRAETAALVGLTLLRWGSP